MTLKIGIFGVKTVSRTQSNGKKAINWTTFSLAFAVFTGDKMLRQVNESVNGKITTRN